MKRLLFILPLVTLLLACCTPQVETTEPTVPDTVPDAVPEPVEGVEGPFQASPALSTIDSLMWQQPDSAFALLLQFAGRPEADSLDTFNLNYFHLLLSELLYKNNCAQSNRNELLHAVASFDSLSSALNNHPLAPGRHSGPDPESPSPYDDLPFLAARAHYINGVGYYESDSLVPACAEYLKALEVMEDRYKEKELVGHKARFMAYIYNRLGDMFSGQYMMKPAIECYENALVFCRIEPTSPRGVSNILSRLGLQYDKLGDKKKMRDYYQKALEEMPDSNNVNYRDLMAIIALCNYQLGAGIEKPMNSLKETLEKAEDESERLTRYITIGDIYYEEGMYDSALYYLEQVFDSTDDIVSRILVAEQLYVIYGSYGDHDQADGYAIFLADSKKPDGDNKAMVSKLEELYKTHTDIIQESNARKAKGKAVRETICVLAVVAVVVGIAIFLIVRRRMKAKTGKMLEDLEKERQEHRNKQAALSGRLKKSNEELRELKEARQQQKDNTMQEQETPTVPFTDEPVCQLILERMNEGKFLSQMDPKIYKEYALSKEQVVALRMTADRHYGQFTSRLKRLHPELTQDDLSYCCLYLLGLSDADVSALMQKAYPTVSQRSRKIKAILGSESPLPITLRGFADNIQR